MYVHLFNTSLDFLYSIQSRYSHLYKTTVKATYSREGYTNPVASECCVHDHVQRPAEGVGADPRGPVIMPVARPPRAVAQGGRSRLRVLRPQLRLRSRGRLTEVRVPCGHQVEHARVEEVVRQIVERTQFQRLQTG